MLGPRLLADGTAALLRMLGVRIHVHGIRHLAVDGPLIVASNHVSYVDFAAVQAARPEGRPPLRFLARWDLVPPGLGGPLMRRLGLIPVDERRRPGRCVPEALEALGRGFALGIHPEGRVRPSPALQPGRGGAVRIAAASGVPLVPCSVWGTQHLPTRGRLRPDLRGGVDVQVRFGPPIDPSGPTLDATGRLMTAIAMLTRASLVADARPPQHRSGLARDRAAMSRPPDRTPSTA